MTAKLRPEYVKCVLTGLYTDSRLSDFTWCGRQVEVFEYAWQDATHASLGALKEERLLICKECALKISETILKHSH